MYTENKVHKLHAKLIKKKASSNAWKSLNFIAKKKEIFKYRHLNRGSQFK